MFKKLFNKAFDFYFCEIFEQLPSHWMVLNDDKYYKKVIFEGEKPENYVVTLYDVRRKKLLNFAESIKIWNKIIFLPMTIEEISYIRKWQEHLREIL